MEAIIYCVIFIGFIAILLVAYTRSKKHVKEWQTAVSLLETFLCHLSTQFHSIKWNNTYGYDGSKRTNEETAKAINARFVDEVGPQVDVLLLKFCFIPDDYCKVFGQDPGSHDFVAQIVPILEKLLTEYEGYDRSDQVLLAEFKSKFFIETERVVLSVLQTTYN